MKKSVGLSKNSDTFHFRLQM